MKKLNNNDLINKKVTLRRNGSHNSIIEFATAVLIILISNSRSFFLFYSAVSAVAAGSAATTPFNVTPFKPSSGR